MIPLLALKLAAGRIWSVLRAIPPLWAAIALCAAVAAFCWHGWHEEAVAHRDNVAALVAAGKRATDAQAALVAKIDADNIAKKDKADEKLPAQSRVADDAARDYIRLHRASSCGSGKAAGTQGAADPEVAQRTDPAPVMVSEADVMICTANTTRLLNAAEWAASLDIVK